MRELFARHGWVEPAQAIVPAVVDMDELMAAQRKSAFLDVGLFNVPISVPGIAGFRERRLTRRVDLLKRFSETAIASRAIKLIRDAVAFNQWDIIAKDTLEEEKLKEEKAIVTRILSHPNPVDDDFPTLIGQTVEDILIWDAGVWEYVENPPFMEDNDVLEIVSVPGYTLSQNAVWRGDPEKTRWAQILNIRGIGPIKFKDSEIEYLVARKRSWTQFGLSPMEVVVEIIESWLGLSSFQRQTASNAYPRQLLYLGEKFTEDQVDRFRAYFRSELTGQAGPGIYGGGAGAPKVLELKPQGDEGLYLKYQEMLMRIFGFAFGLKPQDFSLERDVNRSTAEIGSAASVKEAQEPVARLIQGKINIRTIPKIAKILNKPSIREVQFKYKGIDRRDRVAESKVHDVYLKDDVLTPDDVRAELGKPPYPNQIGQLPMSVLKELAKLNPLIFLDSLEIDVDDSLSQPQVQKVAEQAARRLSNGDDLLLP